VINQESRLSNAAEDLQVSHSDQTDAAS